MIMNSLTEYIPPAIIAERMRQHLKRISSGKKKTECWLWDRAVTAKGYGILSRYCRERKTSIPHYSHRVSAYLEYGPLPKGVVVCHSCDTPSCINPQHLEVKTQLENIRDCQKRGRDKKRGLQGEEHPQSKLTAEKVRSIRQETGTYDEISKKYGISRSAACAAKTGRSWKSV